MKELEEKLARKMKEQEGVISNLEMLVFIKKGYIHERYRDTQTELQKKSVDGGICPFCLNNIDWNKLNILTTKHQKAFDLLNKQLKEINKEGEKNDYERKNN